MGMKYAVAAVRGLARKRQPGSAAVKLRAPLNQLLNALQAFFHQHAGSIGVHDAVTGLNCVLQVQADFVFITQRYSDASLGILRGGFSQLLLGKDQHSAGFSQSNGGPPAAPACSGNAQLNPLPNSLHQPKTS